MTRAILFLMIFALASPAFAQTPAPTLTSPRVSALSSSGVTVDVFGILIGMLKQAQMDLRQSKQLAGQLKQLQLAEKTQNLSNDNSRADTGLREQEEKLRALMAQLDETDRELTKMEQFIARQRSARPSVSSIPPASVRPATTLAPATMLAPKTGGLPRTTRKPGGLAPATTTP